MNTAEKHFEEYCHQENIPFIKIDEGYVRTPDYEFYPKGIQIIAEVKGFERGKDDKQFEDVKVVSKAEPFGLKRVRDKIRWSSRQFKKYQDKPTILILSAITQSNVDFSTNIIEMAMFGDMSYVFPVDPNGKTLATEGDWEFGRNAPSQIVRKKGGSLISAIAVLEKVYPNRKIIQNSLKECVQEAIRNGCDRKETLMKTIECAEKTQNDYPNIDFNEYKLRLRVICNPFAKIIFPRDVFDSQWNEIHVPNLKEI